MVTDVIAQDIGDAGGIAGSGTVSALIGEEPRTGDTTAPELTASTIGAATSKGFSLFLSGTDEKGLNAFRVDTRGEGDDAWVTRYYNAPVSGSGTLDVDIWRQGNYEVRAAACDKEKLVIPGAPHAEASTVDPEKYWSTVDKFIKKYL